MTQSSDPMRDEKPEGNTMSEAEIDETLKESFPASDPPGWTLGVEPRAEKQDESGGDEEDARRARTSG
jgi:hypothetical protein